MTDMKELEDGLDNFQIEVRNAALRDLVRDVPEAGWAVPTRPVANMHAHTFFSYNAYGYSPSHYAWLARIQGMEVAGIVDFDVLDGLDEFHEAGRLLNLKTSAGIESRVCVPEFGDRVINSPGEPGISYHMGIGFPASRLTAPAGRYLSKMRHTARKRNRALITRVNAHTDPVILNYDDDVLPLTPTGNATERHICLAYARKAVEEFENENELAQFWADKLEIDPSELDLPDGPKLQGLIRAKTMKRGGVGYIQPDTDLFPTLTDMNQFIVEANAIPTMTWLGGMTEGEKEIEELLDVEMAAGTAAANIVPDRNFGESVDDQQLKNLYDFVEICRARGLPVIAGTEMNSPGTKFIDDLDSVELKPVAAEFMKGARISYAHSALQRIGGLGYLGTWAAGTFGDVYAKNEFYEEVGKRLSPARELAMDGINFNSKPESILSLLSQ